MKLHNIKPFLSRNYPPEVTKEFLKIEGISQINEADLEFRGEHYKGKQNSSDNPFYFRNDDNDFILEHIVELRPSDIEENVIISISLDTKFLNGDLEKQEKLKDFLKGKLPWPFNTLHFGNIKGTYVIAFDIKGLVNENDKTYNIKTYKEWFKKIHPVDSLNEPFIICFNLDIAEREISLDILIDQYTKKLEEYHKKVEDLLYGLKGFKYVLDKWENKTVSESNKESYWQDLFEEYPWIISTSLSIPAMHFKGRAYVGGKSLNDKGGKIPDFIYSSPVISNLTIIEIKKPSSELVNNIPYRKPDIFGISTELSGALNQLLAYKETLQSEFPTIKNNTKRLLGKDINLLNPKCVLIVGSVEEFKDNGVTTLENNLKLECFERLRNELRSIEIITFDELFEKIRLFLNISTDFIELAQ